MVAGIAALVVAPLATAVVQGAFATGEVSTQPASYQPMSSYADWGVVTFGDTRIDKESEGPLAVGGTLTFSGTQVAMHHAATVDGNAVGLLATSVDLGGSTGELKVQNGGFLAGTATTVKVLTTDDNGASVNAKAVAPSGTYSSTPDIVAQSANGAPSGNANGEFATLFSRSAAVATSDRVHESAQCGIQARAVRSGASVALTLTPGSVNYWSVDAASLSTLRQITVDGSGPSASTPLVIDVTGGTSVVLDLTMANASNASSILWNMPGVTSLTQSGDSVNGSILAPNAALDKLTANIQGTIVTNSATLGGSEEHYFPFTSTLTDCSATGSTSPTPSASATGGNTGSASPSAAASASPSGSVSTSPSRSASASRAESQEGVPSSSSTPSGRTPELARTGSDALATLLGSGAALVTGAAFLGVAQRRRNDRS